MGIEPNGDTFADGWFGIALADDFGEMLRYIGARTQENDLPAIREAGKYAIVLVCKYSFVFALTAAFIGVAANLAQIGFLFSLEPIKPSGKKINPAEGAKKIFSKKSFFEFLKNCLKLIFLGYLIEKIVMRSIPVLLPLCYGTISDVFPVLKELLKSMAAYTAFGYIVIAVVDRLIQQRIFTKDMMMTKDEVKREYKESEGSAEVKQAQRQFRNEILSGPDPRSGTKKANVVVTNPTHLAVGIRYDADEAPLPKVVVSGADRVAKIIRDTAIREGIPIMENIPLARALYAKVKVDEFIPVELRVNHSRNFRLPLQPTSTPILRSHCPSNRSSWYNTQKLQYGKVGTCCYENQ